MPKQTATNEEIKTEESAPTYLPAKFVQLRVDELAKDYLMDVYQKWLQKEGAKAAKQAEIAATKAQEFARLDSEFAKLETGLLAQNDQFASDKNWAGIAANVATIEVARKELEKAKAKLEGKKTPAGDGSLTVSKMEWGDLRNTIFQFRFKGKAFIVAHSSRVKGMAADSDKWQVQECMPVDTESAANGFKTANGIPTLTGKPFTVTIEPKQHGTLSHSGFVNGMAQALRAKGLIDLSASTAYQPWKLESQVMNAAYDWLVVKE